jgi:hypothetical protein
MQTNPMGSSIGFFCCCCRYNSSPRESVEVRRTWITGVRPWKGNGLTRMTIVCENLESEECCFQSLV